MVQSEMGWYFLLLLVCNTGNWWLKGTYSETKLDGAINNKFVELQFELSKFGPSQKSYQ